MIRHSCKYSSNDEITSDHGFVLIYPGDEDSMKYALATKVFTINGYHLSFTVSVQGPISIMFNDVDPHFGSMDFDFHDYKGGIYRSDTCQPDGLNDSLHAMLVVGYGEEDGINSKSIIIFNTNVYHHR